VRELDDKVILVTGASRGIGRALSVACAGAGAHVIIAARNQRALHDTAQEIGGVGGDVVTAVSDVSNQADVLRLVNVALSAFGRIDVLINNAGRQGYIGPVVDADPQEWFETIRTNLLSTMLCSKAVLPSMIALRQGKIINLSGGGATGPRPNFSAYASSKAAVVRFTETLASEVRHFHIDVNAVAPGAINTSMLQEVLLAGHRAGEAEMNRANEQQRRGGTSLEFVVGLVLFLSSSSSDGLTGKLINAVHDPWTDWKTNSTRLTESQQYTLRRLDPFTLQQLKNEPTS
jgi:NAD(P)-dependent dehydrogenase (short-subunit alcohol dehydrogenase family)